MTQRSDRAPKEYEKMTAEELEQELREVFFCTDRIDGHLSEELERIREALDKKQPVDFLYTPEESWTQFRASHEEELKRLLKTMEDAEAGKSRTAKRRSIPALLRWGLIAAVIVVLLAGAALAADSLGLVAWVPRWNTAAGRYEPTATEVSGESPIREALAELKITEPVYPAKLPEGFVITESHINKDPLLLTERYARGDRVLSVTITPIRGVKTAVYQPRGAAPRTLGSGKDVYYAFENEEVITVVWLGKDYATTLSGNLPLAELEAVIDSLGEETKGGPQP